MDNHKLNKKALQYQKSKCEEDFTRIFEQLKNLWDRKNLFFSKTRRNIDIETVVDVFLTKAYTVALRYDGKGDYSAWVNREVIDELNNIDKMLARKKRDRSLEVAPTTYSADGEELDLFETISDPIASHEMDRRIKKGEQRQLLSDLLANADEIARQSLSAYATTGSYREAAKLLGTNASTVQRRVRSIAKKYDANRYGNISDYLSSYAV